MLHLEILAHQKHAYLLLEGKGEQHAFRQKRFNTLDERMHDQREALTSRKLYSQRWQWLRMLERHPPEPANTRANQSLGLYSLMAWAGGRSE